jgi:hypothetical protein
MTTADRSRRVLRVLLVVLGLVAVVLLAGLGPAAHADVAFTDINGTAVNVHLRLPDANTGNLIELPLPTDQLPAAASALLATPLSTLFDTYWSGTQDADGKTLRDHSCDGAVIQTAAAVASKTGGTAHDITCNLSATGSLRAAVVQGSYFSRAAADPDFPDGNFVDGTRLVLSYVLTGNSIAFSVAPLLDLILAFSAPRVCRGPAARTRVSP